MMKIDQTLTLPTNLEDQAVLDQKTHVPDWNKKKNVKQIKAKQSNTPSRETKLDQVRASIAKYSGKKPSSSANKPVTRSQTKNSSPGSSNQNLNLFIQEINATYLSSSTDILYSPHSFAHCISADFAMAKGLAQQVKSWYPETQRPHQT